MTGSMIERVARAMCAETGCDPDLLVMVAEPMRYVAPTPAGHVCSVGPTMRAWEAYGPLARVAIEAMREPTEAMKEMIDAALTDSGTSGKQP